MVYAGLLLHAPGLAEDGHPEAVTRATPWWPWLSVCVSL